MCGNFILPRGEKSLWIFYSSVQLDFTINHLNSDYLARLFKKETGQSLGAYLQDRRIHEAKKLLVQTNIQVNEIAQRVGYDNFSYFSHTFREKTGVTPNEYRKNKNCL